MIKTQVLEIHLHFTRDHVPFDGTQISGRLPPGRREQSVGKVRQIIQDEGRHTTERSLHHSRHMAL
jgi:hypothetical protein